MYLKIKILFTLGIFFLLPVPNYENVSFVNKKFPKEDFYRNFNKISWNDQQGIFAADLLNPSTSLVGKKIIMYPNNYLNLNISKVDFDLSPTETETIYNNKLLFDKQLSLFNPSNKTDTVKIDRDDSGVLTFIVNETQVSNGPFTIFPEEDKLNVRSHYNNLDVIPLNIIYKKDDSIVDEIKVKWEENFPPYYVSMRLKNKNVITSKDILEILKSYTNLSGDYFDQNHKNLVCTDAFILPLKTVGIDYLSLLKENNIKGNDFIQRNYNVFEALLKKLNLYDNYIHYFMNGNVKKIYQFNRYKKLIAENFGIPKFEPGQVMLYDRYYNTGPQAGEVQRLDVHTALISKTSKGLITKAAMVTSRSTKKPYNTLIMMNWSVNFPAWFGYRQHYNGSDETKEELRYVVYAVLDLQPVIQKLRAIYLPPTLASKN